MVPLTTELSPWVLISNAGPFAKTILGILFLISAYSWAVIGLKLFQLRKAIRQNDKFLAFLRNKGRISEVSGYQMSTKGNPIGRIFNEAVKELHNLTERPHPQPSVTMPPAPARLGLAYNQNIVDALIYQFNRVITEEMTVLERHNDFLATTASVSPFLGLLGTVWGIMRSFIAIGAVGSTNIAVVAPGIAEALIATAVGLGAAIPAVVAYNYFVGKLRQIHTQFEQGASLFLNLVRREMEG